MPPRLPGIWIELESLAGSRGAADRQSRERKAAGADGSLLAVDDGEDLVLAQDHIVFVFDLDLAARVLAHQDPVAGLDVHRRALALVGQLAGTDGDDLGLLGLLL